MPEYIRLDLFPAIVTRADGTVFDPVRAVVTDDSLYVFQDDNPTPRIVLQELLHDFSARSRTAYTVVTDDEQESITIVKRAGCGCGNKLRGFRPFPGTPLKKNS